MYKSTEIDIYVSVARKAFWPFLMEWLSNVQIIYTLDLKCRDFYCLFFYNLFLCKVGQLTKF